ncbi:MAG: response regulator [Deltaproteobacteria bacterium]|nr:response regulator [Deltaproteobacteria bacterium]
MPDISKRVLVVDDTPELVRAARRRLQAAGFDVDTAVDGLAALEAMAREVPDAVVLDVMMPNLNGFQVCRRIRAEARYAGVKVVMLTARTSAADQFWGEQAGADRYLAKPLDPAALADVLTELLQETA